MGHWPLLHPKHHRAVFPDVYKRCRICLKTSLNTSYFIANIWPGVGDGLDDDDDDDKKDMLLFDEKHKWSAEASTLLMIVVQISFHCSSKLIVMPLLCGEEYKIQIQIQKQIHIQIHMHEQIIEMLYFLPQQQIDSWGCCCVERNKTI